jgi:glycosyltransferase involved in cell wall biosynthesis
MEKFEEGLVSIIIPVFNREVLLLETLDTILSQTYTKWECIIVDDGSTDSSLNVAMEYASKDSRIKVINRPWYKKKGANSCRNYGFELSKGEFIQWFDSDDIMSSDMINKKVCSFISNYIDIVLCGASFFSLNIENKILSKIKSIEPITDNPAFEYFSGNFWFGTPQAMFRRKLVSQMPYIFNLKLKRNQETEFYVRLLLKDLNISFINECLINIRLHDKSITGNYSLLSQENKIAIDLDAYISMFLAFKKEGRLTDDVFNFFSDYFFRCLRKMNYKSFNYLYLYIFGNFYSLFPSFVISTRVLFYRYRKNV